MGEGRKEKRQVIDRYRVRLEAKEDKNECIEMTKGIQGVESGAEQE